MELEKAVLAIGIMIYKCESMLEKFPEGTSQHSLLMNRIKALEISKALIAGEEPSCPYTKEELEKALPPVCSIISKCKKAQAKHEKGTSQYTRYERMTAPMDLAKALIEEELNRIGEADGQSNS